MTALKDQRPLSPHLLIYRPQITSVLSILHRITGFSLSLGSLFLVAWLWAAAYDADYFNWWAKAAAHPLGLALLVGWTAAFYYHLANGIRHLFWDIGKGFALANVTRSGIAVLVFTAAMTGLTWALLI